MTSSNRAGPIFARCALYGVLFILPGCGAVRDLPEVFQPAASARIALTEADRWDSPVAPEYREVNRLLLRGIDLAMIIDPRMEAFFKGTRRAFVAAPDKDGEERGGITFYHVPPFVNFKLGLHTEMHHLKRMHTIRVRFLNSDYLPDFETFAVVMFAMELSNEAVHYRQWQKEPGTAGARCNIGEQRAELESDVGTYLFARKLYAYAKTQPEPMRRDLIESINIAAEKILILDDFEAVEKLVEAGRAQEAAVLLLQAFKQRYEQYFGSCPEKERNSGEKLILSLFINSPEGDAVLKGIGRAYRPQPK